MTWPWTVNGTNVGDVTFTGEDKGTIRVKLPTGLLEWSNTVTLTAQNGDYDISLVDYIRITYPHLYRGRFRQIEISPAEPGRRLP